MLTIATVVDVHVLWQLIVASLIGGIGVSLAFSLTIYGATRWSELRRDGHLVAAGAFAALAAVTLATVAAGVVYAVALLAQKS